MLRLIAVSARRSLSTMATPVHSDKLPKAIGPYSPGMIANGFLFVSGQLPAIPATGELLDGDVHAATKQCLANVQAVLEAGGCSIKDVVKTTCFLRDMADFPKFNEAYAEVFGDCRPARAAVQPAMLPKNAIVEIEAIALVPAKH